MRINNMNAGIPYIQPQSKPKTITYEAKEASLYFGDMLNIGQGSFITESYDNYAKGLSSLDNINRVEKKSSILSLFKEEKTDIPNLRCFVTYVDRKEGNGKIKLSINLTNCGKDETLNEKALEEAFKKVLDVQQKFNKTCEKIGFEVGDIDSFGTELKYNKDGKIDVTEFLKGMEDLLELKIGQLEVDDKTREKIEKIKKEMGDYLFKMLERERNNGLKGNLKKELKTNSIIPIESDAK